DGGMILEPALRPDIFAVFDAVTDGHQRLWLELGSGLLGRLTVRGDEMIFDTFDKRHGVPEGWVQAYVLDGVPRFNIADRLYRFDEERQRIVPDEEMRTRLAEFD